VVYRRRRTSGETHPTLYARALRLKHIHPGGLLCFLLFEGAMGLAVLMALAEFVTWPSVILLPLAVALVMKINDMVAGVFSRTDRRRGRTVVLRPVIWARGVATVPSSMAFPPVRRSDAALVPIGPPSAVYGVSYARRNDDDSVGVPVATRSGGHRRATNQRRFMPITPLHQMDRAS
jgi:hypothetical protein